MFSKIKIFLQNPNTEWQVYKDFFQITIFKYLVTWFSIVPLIALLLSDLPSVFKIDFFHTEIEYSFNLELPFSWKMLWSSSLCFVIAFLLYLFRCPKFIKKYNSYKDYLIMQHDPRWIIYESRNIFINRMNISKFFERISSKNYINKVDIKVFEAIKAKHAMNRDEGTLPFEEFGVIVEEKQSILYFKHQKEAFSLAAPALGENNQVDNEKSESMEKGLFWEVFGRYSESHSKTRMTILALLAASGLLFLFVFMQNIISGLKFLF